MPTAPNSFFRVESSRRSGLLRKFTQSACSMSSSSPTTFATISAPERESAFEKSAVAAPSPPVRAAAGNIGDIDIAVTLHAETKEMNTRPGGRETTLPVVSRYGPSKNLGVTDMSMSLMRYLLAALCLAMIGCSPAPMTGEATTDTSEAAPSEAQPMSPQAVVEQHVQAMQTGDIEIIMRDYADDVVVITPQGMVSDQTPKTGPGVFSGVNDAQRVFATITQPANMDAVKGMETRIEPKGEDIAFLHWTMSKGTPDELSGVDVFVVRDSKIEYQNIIFNE